MEEIKKACEEVKKDLEKMLKNDTKEEEIKPGDIIIETDNKNITIKTIEKGTYGIRIRTGDLLEFTLEEEGDVKIGKYHSYSSLQTTNQYYKIKNPEQVRKTIKNIGYRHTHEILFPLEKETALKILKKILKETQKISEYNFLEMDQTLPAKLQEMRPEERLKHIKRLEAFLEKKINKANHKNMQEMKEMKKLYEYAQKIGVVSDAANQLYKEKWHKLRKRVRKLELD